jgi:hypothetical protein
MLTDQQFFGLEGSLRNAKGQMPLETCDAQIHKIVDAITAAVTGAQAGLNWLRAEPPNLGEVRETLNSIANDGKRAAEIVVRLRALMEKVSRADRAADPSS